CGRADSDYVDGAWFKVLRDGRLPLAERKTTRVQGFDHLVDRLLAEVRDRIELTLTLGNEVADGLDTCTLQAVVRTNTELELLDQDVIHRVRSPSAAATSLVAVDAEAGIKNAAGAGVT